MMQIHTVRDLVTQEHIEHARRGANGCMGLFAGCACIFSRCGSS